MQSQNATPQTSPASSPLKDRPGLDLAPDKGTPSPMEHPDPQDDLLMDHDADGIKVLDNGLPSWWTWMFYISIVFAVIYFCYYHVFSMGDLQVAAYQKEMQQGEAIKQKAILAFESSLDSLEPSQDPAVLNQGLGVYTLNCAPCHRDDGGGLVGSNLCDDYWIHGSTYLDNIKIIITGIPEKGMLTWRGILRPTEIQAVTSYIQQFKGTHPVNPKPPENQAPIDPGPSEFE